MYILLLAILVISSICLIILVLMQSGKGSGLSGAFGSAGGGESSLFGANTATVVMKATAVFAVIFMLSCIVVAIYQRSMYKPLSFGKIPVEDTTVPGIIGTKETPEEENKPEQKDTITPSGEETTTPTEATENSGTSSETENKEGNTESPEQEDTGPVNEQPAGKDN